MWIGDIVRNDSKSQHNHKKGHIFSTFFVEWGINQAVDSGILLESTARDADVLCGLITG